MDAFYGFSSLEYILEECPAVSEFDKVCRICLSRKDLQSVFQYCDDFSPLPQDFSSSMLRYLGVAVDRSDVLPDKICQKCVNVLTMLLHMKQLSENTEERLRHALEEQRKDAENGVKVEFDSQSEVHIIEPGNEIGTEKLCKFEEFPDNNVKDEITYEYEQDDAEDIGNRIEMSAEECSKQTTVENLQLITKDLKQTNRIKPGPANSQQFKCTRCVYSFPHRAGLERHLISKHGKVRTSEQTSRARDQKLHGDARKRVTGHPCQKCPKVFRSERGLLKHCTMYHPWFSVNATGKALCPTCGKDLERKHIVGHMMTHQKSNTTQSKQPTFNEGPRAQPRDDAQLSGETTQLLTLFDEVAQGRVVCKLCGYEYGRKNILRHIRGHLKDAPAPKKTYNVQPPDESQPYTVNSRGKAVCKLCSNEYHRRSILRHMRTHQKRLRTPKICKVLKKKENTFLKPPENTTFYECLFCEQSFPFRGGLDQHMVSEHGKLFTCYWCDQVFKFRKSKYRHMKLACSNKPTTSFPCKECPRVFNTLKKFMLHVDQQHVSAAATGELKRLFGCSQCKSTFTSTSSFKAHMSTHLKIRTLCTICGKKCGPNSLNSHMKTHAERTIKCDQCPYRTNMLNNLKVHQRSHSGERPYACELCPHRSVNMSNLIVHQLTHSGIRRFQCSECGNKYKDKRLLVDHINFVHRKLRLNRCPHCSKSYGSSKHVRRHIRTVHLSECKDGLV